MSEKSIQWHKIAESINEIPWQQNNMAIVEAGGKKVTLALVNNKIKACLYSCPHAGGVLADGFIDATGNIVCPLHRYKFSLVNGRNVSGEGYYLKTYAIEEKESGIYVGFEESKWMNFLK